MEKSHDISVIEISDNLCLKVEIRAGICVQPKSALFLENSFCLIIRYNDTLSKLYSNILHFMTKKLNNYLRMKKFLHISQIVISDNLFLKVENERAFVSAPKANNSCEIGFA